MSDVAKRAGVSLKTVSNVVNDFPYVRKETRARVESAIQELGYQINMSARNLRRGNTGLIRLAIPELGVPYFAQLAQTMTTAAQKRGLQVILELSESSRDKEIEILQSPLQSIADALIFSPVRITEADMGYLNVPYPLILLGERVFGAPVDHVTMANVEGARAATEHLLSCGARRILLLGHHPWVETSSASLRFEGYHSALQQAGLEVDPELLVTVGSWRRQTGAEAMERVLADGVTFDAVFCMNDAMALGALHVLHAHRISVPEQVQVIGFDDIEEAAYSIPTLTTIAPGLNEIVETALDMVELRVNGGRSGQSRLVVAPFHLIWRDSTQRRN